MLTQEQIIRLQDIGFLACHSGAVYEGRKIFDSLREAQPDNTVAQIGKALSYIVVDAFPEAETILRDQVLAAHPDDPEAISLLGLCYTLSNRQEEAKTLLGRIDRQQNAPGQLARDLLAGLAQGKP